MREKARVAAIVIAMLYGAGFIGAFFLLAGLSLFGTDRPFHYFLLFLILGIGYLYVCVGIGKKRKIAAYCGIVISAVTAPLLIRHYSFVTGAGPSAATMLIRVLSCMPLPALIVFLWGDFS